MQGTSLKLGSIGITTIYVGSQGMLKACKKTFQLLFFSLMYAFFEIFLKFQQSRSIPMAKTIEKKV